MCLNCKIPNNQTSTLDLPLEYDGCRCFFYINQISQIQAALHMMCQRVHNLKHVLLFIIYIQAHNCSGFLI